MKTRTCLRCGNKVEIGKRCKKCQANHMKQTYIRHKQLAIERARQKRARLVAISDKIKSVPCMDCGGIFNPWQMDFDHRDGEEKLGQVSTLITKASKKRVMDEIAKCDIICSNCHRQRTYERSQCGSKLRQAVRLAQSLSHE